MISFFKKLWRDRRGNAIVIVAAALPLLIGSAGLASDTIEWTVWKRQLQRAADSGALAGVHALVAGNTVDKGTCPDLSNPTYASPVQYDLQRNNHVLAGSTSVTACKIENAPSSGAYSTDVNAVRVTLSAQKKLGFSSLFLSTPPTITASATATVVATGKYCVISLEKTNATGITFQGNADVDLGCGMVTNSRGSSAVSSGGSPTVNASPIAAVGAIPSTTGFSSDTIVQPYSAPQPDPFASINAPASSTFPAANCPNFRVNANATQSRLTLNTDYRLMTSGYYCMGSMTLNGHVSLPDGVYIIDGGNFSVGSQAVVTCAHCSFVLTNRSTSTTATIGSVNMDGGATVTLGYSTTSPYAGLLFYQDRRAQLANGGGQSNLINGNSSSSFAGSFYFPSTAVIFNGTSGMQTDCIQLVARQATFTGNTAISNTCPDDGITHVFDATTIRLVA
jgi:Flp pilus assembly protein TadG